MDKPTVGKIATVAKPITREQFDEAYLLMANTANPTSIELLKWCDIIHAYANQRDATIDRMVAWIFENDACNICQEIDKKPCGADVPTLGCRKPLPDKIKRYFVDAANKLIKQRDTEIDAPRYKMNKAVAERVKEKINCDITMAKHDRVRWVRLDDVFTIIDSLTAEDV